MTSHQLSLVFNHFLLKFFLCPFLPFLRFHVCEHVLFFLSLYVGDTFSFRFPSSTPPASSQIPNIIHLILLDIHSFPNRFCKCPAHIKTTVPLVFASLTCLFYKLQLSAELGPAWGLHQMFAPPPHARHCLSLDVLERRPVFADVMKWLQFKCL